MASVYGDQGNGSKCDGRRDFHLVADMFPIQKELKPGFKVRILHSLLVFIGKYLWLFLFGVVSVRDISNHILKRVICGLK